MGMTTEELLNHFRGVKKTGMDHWKALNPLGDNNPSLSITADRENGKTLLYAFNGGTAEDILAAVGLNLSDLFYPGTGSGSRGRSWQEKAEEYLRKKFPGITLRDSYTYSYTESGEYAFTKIRLLKEDGEKDFRYGTLNDDRDYLKIGLNGKKRADLPVAVYGSVKKILEAKETDHKVYYCEGEKDVETLQEYGLLVFTAGSAKDGESEAERFAPLTAGADLVIFSDNDDPGRESSAAVFKACKKYAKTVKIIVPMKDEPKADISDFMKIHTKTELDKLIEEADDTREVLDQTEQTAADNDQWDDLEPISIVDLLEMDIPELYFPVKDMIPEGLSYIGAAPKSGKSWLMMDLCISVATGKPFLGHETQQSDCIYFDLENPDIGLKTRLQKMVTDNPLPENVRVVFSDQILKKVKGDAFPRLDSGFDVILERMIQKNPKARLIIIDTLAHISARRLRNEDPIDKDSRNGLILKRIAEKYHVAIVVVTHTTKMKYDENIFNNISGTSGVTAMSNLNMVLMKENKNSPVSILACQERYAENHIYNMRFDQNCLRWIYLGEAAGEPGDREEQQKLEEFLSSDIRKAVKEICEKDFNGYKGSVTGFIEKASAYGIGVPETRKHIGMFLSENIGKFAKYDGITITATSNGNAGRTYSMRLWRPEGQNSDNSQ